MSTEVPPGAKKMHEHDGYYPFAAKMLEPGESAVFALGFELPFRLLTFLAAPHEAAGLEVEDILVGERSLIVSAGALPIGMFYPACMPIRWADPDVPVGTCLKMRVRNPTKVARSLRVTVVGTSSSDVSPEEVGFQAALQFRRAWSWLSCLLRRARGGRTR